MAYRDIGAFRRDRGRDHRSPRRRMVCRSAQGRLIFAFGADGEMERSHSRRTDIGLTGEVRRTSGNRRFSQLDRCAMKASREVGFHCRRMRASTDVGVELVLAANVSSAGCCRRQSKCRRPSCHRRRRSRTPMAWRPHTPGFGAPVRTGWKAGKQYLSVSRRPSHPRTSNAGRGHLVSHTSLAVVGRLRLGAGASSPIS